MDSNKLIKMVNKIGISVVGASLGTLVAGPVGTVIGASLGDPLGKISETIINDTISEITNFDNKFKPESDISIDARQITFKESWNKCDKEIFSVPSNNDNFCDLLVSEKERQIPQQEIYGALNCTIAIKRIYSEIIKIDSGNKLNNSDLNIATAAAAYFCDGVVNTAIFKNSNNNMHIKYPRIFDDDFPDIADNFPLEIENILFELCCPNNRYDFYLGWKRNCTIIHTENSLRNSKNRIVSPFVTLRSRMLNIMGTAIQGQIP